MDAHIVVKDGDQYALKHNDTKLIWEEVNINYTVTLMHDYRKLWFILTDHLLSCTAGSSTLLFSCYQVERSGDVMTPPLNLIVSFPHLSPLKNKILDLTHFSASSGVCTHIHTASSSKQAVTLMSASHCSAGQM